MLIIWKALVSYLCENLRAARSVNIRKFGAFTFDINTELPKIAQRHVGANGDLYEQREERKHVHKVRPCFVVDPALQMHLSRYLGKEEITPAKSQHSMFQKGFRMIYCNPVPIASACLLGKDVVQDALNAIFQGIIDLVKFGRDIDLQFGICNVKIYNRNLKVIFRDDFVKGIQDKGFEQSMKRSTSPVSAAWKTKYTDTFARSTLGNLIQKPNQEVTKTLNEKTQALKMMSLDMSSAARFSPQKGPVASVKGSERQ